MEITPNHTEPNNYTFWDFKGRYAYVDDWWFMGSPFPVFTVLVTYWILVLKLGPQLMKQRRPFNLNTVLIVYNIFQVILSAYMVIVGSEFLWKYGIIGSSCVANMKEGQRFITERTYLYMVAKFSELLDTIFFVLRKKHSQVTFLHVYHHSFMLLASWTVLKYDPSDTGVFLGTLNSFVHTIMYGYYGLSAVPGLAKYLWWKKYITIMQLAQFVAVLIQIVVKYKVMDCPPSRIFLFAAVFNALLFIYLFSDFYIKSFAKRKLEKNNANGVSEDTRHVKNILKANDLKQRISDGTSLDKMDSKLSRQYPMKVDKTKFR